MADLIELTAATAVASGRWSRNGETCSWYAWAKDPSAVERNAVFFCHGGAETNWEDLELGTNATYLMLVNELNCVVFSYDVSPGFFRLESGEATDSRDVFDTAHEHMAAISHLRTICGFSGNSVLPSGMWITTDPDKSMHAGSSSGGYNALRTQLAPDGSLPYSRDRVVRGEARFARVHSHACNVVYAHIAQTTLSQFCEYVATTSGDTTYTASATALVGATSISISGDTVELKRANRVTFNVGGTDYQYAVTADSGASPSSVSIYPSVEVEIPAGTALVLQHPAPESYGDQSWAQQYLFSRGSGFVWRSDDASGDGFPIEVKRQADVDYMLDVSNPRVHDITFIFAGPTGTSMVTSALTGERSFLTWYTPGEINPLYIDLHDEAQSMWVAHWIYYTAGNTNVHAYVGNSTSNVNPGDGSVLWNKGRNSAFDAPTMKAILQAKGW